MKLRKLGLLATVLGAFLGFGSTAHAQWSGQITDLGVVYTLSDLTVGPSTTHTYSLVLNTSGYNHHADPSFLDAVNIKAWSTGSNDMSFVLTDAPNGIAAWSSTEGPINNGSGGCGSSDAGFACVEAISKGVFNVDTGPYSFTFQVTTNDAASFFSTEIDAKIGAGYADGSGAGASYGITSMLIPEPEIYAMLLAGLGLMGFVARRRQQGSAA